MAGLTNSGFTPKRLPELKLELEDGLRQRFGDVNLNSESVFGQLVGLVTEQQADLWARLEQVYQSQYPNMATGVNLDRVASITGLTRLGSAPTFARATVTGAEGTVLPTGRRVSSATGAGTYVLTDTVTITAGDSCGATVEVANVVSGINYTLTLGGVAYTYNSGADPTEASILVNIGALLPTWVTHTVVSGAEGAVLTLEYGTPQLIEVDSKMTLTSISVYADFENEVPGRNALPVGTLTQITTPVSGWTGITNREEGTIGRDAETDDELRLRREKSLRLAGASTMDSIVSELTQLTGVISVRVTANSTDTTDADGTPRQTLWAIVDGGEAEAIGEVLYEKVAAGIGTRGAVVVDVVSGVSGQVFQMKFDRPTNVPFYAEVTIQRSASTPSDAIERVRSALVAYAETLKIGDPVHYTRLFSPINAVIGDGAHVSDLFIGLTPSPSGTTNIVPAPSERLTLTAGRIQVFVV